jgi:ABC-2 type transport system ATP-binding protein
MDEPTSALDPAGRADAWEALHRFRDDGTTIVVVTHDTIEASRHCDAIVLLHHGRIAAFGPPSELVATHGTWMLEIRLAKAPADSALLAASIDLANSATPVVAGNRLMLRASGMDADAAIRMKDRVIERLQRAGEAVLGFRLEPPDLASAYFALTGARIMPSDRAVPRQRTRAGQRRMAA